MAARDSRPFDLAAIQFILQGLDGDYDANMAVLAVESHFNYLSGLRMDQLRKHIKNFSIELVQRYQNPYELLRARRPPVTVQIGANGPYEIDYGAVWLEALTSINSRATYRERLEELRRLVVGNFTVFCPSHINFVAVGVGIINHQFSLSLSDAPTKWPYEVTLTMHDFGCLVTRLARYSPVARTWASSTIERLMFVAGLCNGVSVLEDRSIAPGTLVSAYVADAVRDDDDWFSLCNGPFAPTTPTYEPLE